MRCFAILGWVYVLLCNDVSDGNYIHMMCATYLVLVFTPNSDIHARLTTFTYVVHLQCV